MAEEVADFDSCEALCTFLSDADLSRPHDDGSIHEVLVRAAAATGNYSISKVYYASS